MTQLGYLPDPEIYEPGHHKAFQLIIDHNAKDMMGITSLGPPPESASIRHRVVDVLDQGNIGSCVANAGMQAIRMMNWSPLGARLWGYWLARTYHGMEGFDTGTHIRSFFRAMNSYGFLAERDYKYGYQTSHYSTGPPPKAFRKAFDQRDPSNPFKYRRIFGKLSERADIVRRAIAAGHPVVFGTDVSITFQRLRGHSGVIGRPHSDDLAGGHAMVIVGYDAEGFEIVNSWGERWGNGGFAKLSNDYIMWDKTRDLWVVESAPTFSE